MEAIQRRKGEVSEMHKEKEMTTTTPQSTTEPPCTNSCSGCKNCDHHFYLRDNGQLECKHCLYSRPVTRFEVDAISLVGQWNYEEPFWWAPIATALAKEFREGQTRAALRQYFCSCGGALTAEEYITHYFDLGHDRGEPAFTASAAPVVDNEQTEGPRNWLHEGICIAYANAMRQACVRELYVMKAEHKAAGTYPQGVGTFDEIAKRLESLALTAAANAAPQQPRSNHFPDEALNRGFPDHISRDGTAHYSDGTVLSSVAPVEQQAFKNTKEAMLYVQRNNIPAVVPVQPSAQLDEATMEWALRELADGWIQNNEREGPHGFYQNARRVLNAIVS